MIAYNYRQIIGNILQQSDMWLSPNSFFSLFGLLGAYRRVIALEHVEAVAASPLGHASFFTSVFDVFACFELCQKLSHQSL